MAKIRTTGKSRSDVWAEGERVDDQGCDHQPVRKVQRVYRRNNLAQIWCKMFWGIGGLRLRVESHRQKGRGERRRWHRTRSASPALARATDVLFAPPHLAPKD